MEPKQSRLKSKTGRNKRCLAKNYSLNGLAGKIIKGKFPSVSSQYSKNLRALVNDMLATNPKKRPDIEQILRKSFVQTRVKEFVGDLDADELHRQVSLPLSSLPEFLLLPGQVGVPLLEASGRR